MADDHDKNQKPGIWKNVLILSPSFITVSFVVVAAVYISWRFKFDPAITGLVGVIAAAMIGGIFRFALKLLTSASRKNTPTIQQETDEGKS